MKKMKSVSVFKVLNGSLMGLIIGQIQYYDRPKIFTKEDEIYDIIISQIKDHVWLDLCRLPE